VRRVPCPSPRGYILLLAYGWSLTTWVVKVTLEAVGLTKCDHSLGLPDDQPISWFAARMSRMSEANPQDAKRP
jgi:hypothetical protein